MPLACLLVKCFGRPSVRGADVLQLICFDVPVLVARLYNRITGICCSRSGPIRCVSRPSSTLSCG